MDTYMHIVIVAAFLTQLVLIGECQFELTVGDAYSVQLLGFENDQLWPQRAQGVVIIKDKHGKSARVKLLQATDFEVKLLCKTLGYSDGFKRAIGSSQLDEKYKNIPMIDMLDCKGTEIAIDQCMTGRVYYRRKTNLQALEIYCTSPWYGPGVPCGTDVGVETLAENNRWSLNYSVAVELEELTGISERSLGMTLTRMPRTVQPSRITFAGEFPWTAKLNFWNGKEWEYRCGAAIITDRIVLTLASCVDRIGYYSVDIGEFDSEVRNIFEDRFEVLNYRQHPDFRKDPTQYDIAVVVLKEKETPGIVFRTSALPVCLPSSDAPLGGNREAVVAGWGKQVTPESATISRFLTIANVKLLFREKCEGHERYNPSIICAGNLEGGSDACFLDYGAPLITKINGRSLLVGLMKEPGCGIENKPSKYVSIRYHIKWIRSTVAEISAQLYHVPEEEEEEFEDEEDEDDEWL